MREAKSDKRRLFLQSVAGLDASCIHKWYHYIPQCLLYAILICETQNLFSIIIRSTGSTMCN